MGISALKKSSGEIGSKAKAAIQLDEAMKSRVKRTRRATRAAKRRWIGSEPLPAKVVQKLRNRGNEDPDGVKPGLTEAKFDSKVL